jgi:MraZ protein
MWLGESTHTLDDKGRLSIPRRLLAGQTLDDSGRMAFIVTRGFEGCLFLFTEKAFKSAVERLVTQPFAGAEARNMQRQFFSASERIELDEKNRVSLPERLVKAAGLEREVVVVGVMERAEIWPKARWEAFQREREADFEQLDRVLCPERPSGAAGA